MRRLLSIVLYAIVVCVSFTATSASAAIKDVLCRAEDLQSAIANAKNGDILALSRNCTYSITHTAHTLLWDRQTPDKRALKTIDIDLTIEGNGATIRPAEQVTVYQRICDVLAYAGNCLDSKEIAHTTGESMGIFRVSSGNLTLKNLTLSNGSSPRGGAIYQVDGKVSLKGVTITDSEAYSDIIYSGVAAGRGGAIMQSGGTLSLEDSTIKYVFANIHGGAIYSENGKLDLLRTTIEESSSGRGGGALYIAGSDVQISDSPLRNNYTQYSYGNFNAYLHDIYEFGNLNPAYSPEKPTPSSGGAIYAETGSISLTGDFTKISNNAVFAAHYENENFGVKLDVPVGTGGGIYASEGVKLTISGGATVSGNKPDNCNSIIAKICAP